MTIQGAGPERDKTADDNATHREPSVPVQASVCPLCRRRVAGGHACSTIPGRHVKLPLNRGKGGA